MRFILIAVAAVAAALLLLLAEKSNTGHRDTLRHEQHKH